MKTKASRAATSCLMLLTLLGCRAATEVPGAIAVFDGGSVTLGDVESVLLELPPERRLRYEQSILDTYREVARRLALARILEPDLADAESGYAARREAMPALYRQSVNRLYLEETGLFGHLSVSEPEIEAYYDAHPERFHRPGARQLNHLYRRHDDPQAPEETVAYLHELRAQLAAGASFEEVARRHSHSETAELGGRLGWVPKGALPPRLEALAFALAPGEVSEPILVPGGAVLFQAHEVLPEKTFTLGEARAAIGQQLLRQKQQERMEELVAGVASPGGALVLDEAGFAAAVAAGDPQAEVLRIHEQTLTWGDLVDRANGGVPDWTAYRTIVVPHLLLERAVDEGFADREDVRRRIGQTLRRAEEASRVEATLRERMRSSESIDDADLRRFHDDHQQLYQTAPRVRLRTLAVPLGGDPAERMARLEAFGEELTKGERTLDEAAAELGGEVGEPQWHGAALEGLEVKAASHVRAVRATGFTVPFRVGDRLSIVEVMAREAPRPLPFEEVADRVREDYIARHQQELYAQVVDAVLDGARFRYLEDRVAAALTPE